MLVMVSATRGSSSIQRQSNVNTLYTHLDPPLHVDGRATAVGRLAAAWAHSVVGAVSKMLERITTDACISNI